MGALRRGVAGEVGGQVTAALLALVTLLGVTELWAPHDVTLSSAMLLPVVLAMRLCGRAGAAAVLVAAVLVRVVAAALGDISPALAGVDMLSYAVVAAIARPHRRTASMLRRSRLGLVPEPTPAPPETSALTPRERQVVSLAVRGLSAAVIGDRLHIGRRTVETHLSHAYAKLGFRSRQELIAHSLDAFAAQRGETGSASGTVGHDGVQPPRTFW